MSDTSKITAVFSTDEKRRLLAELLQQKARKSNTFPLSFAQQRLWFLDQWEPGNPFYNISRTLSLIGSLNIAALEQSLNEIVRRHEVLRTTFATVDGQPIQVIAPTLTVTLLTVDLSGLPQPERETEAQRLATKEAQRPFDLARGPLLRARLLRLADEEHVLLLTMHHIVADGWSLSVFFRELAALYDAYSHGKPSPLPELPIQYVDFALWQREWLQSEVLEAQLAYWRQQLADAPAMLDLPTDRPRPAQQSFRGAHHAFVLSPGLTEDLKTLSRRKGVTLFMTLLAAFVTLLSRYSGQEDLLVGSPIANRTRAELEDLIGFFVNTLVLRTDLSGNPSFQQLLGRVREVTLEAYAHQDLPFEKLVEELQPRRDPSRSPLVQAMFVLQNAPREALELAGVSVRPLAVERTTANFDLTLEFTEIAEGLAGLLEYNTDLFEAATISRMAGHYRRLLEEIVADPQQRLSELPLLTEAERQQLLVVWNKTQTAYPQHSCIHEVFEAQVERSPEAVAVVFEDEQLSYRELNRQANQLAHYLQRLGVGPEVRMGLCVERSLEMVVGLLGILKAGGAYVPLDPAYPTERLAYMLADAEVAVLLTQQRLQARLPTSEARVLWLDGDWQASAAASGGNPVSGVQPENLAYVIYTSGSTGRPKGVLIPHLALVNHSIAVARHYGLQPTDRVLQFASLSFDVAAEELFPTWLSGASVILRSDQLPIPPEDFLHLLEQERLTVVNLPAPSWHEWVSELSRSEAPVPPTLRLVIVGSEKVLPDRLAVWQKLAGERIRWINAYGSTETTITTTIYEPGGVQERQEVLSVPIGRPIANTQVYLLDSHLHPVPIGVPGELYIGGLGLVHGYLNRPDLTAERFVPNPFSQQPGARLYKTGDLARYLPDGNLEFLGRTDHQVKVRGFRIELGEIEAVLAEHPAVREAVVLAREDVPGDKRLVAYVVPQSEQELVISQLREYVAAKLPDYMVPAAFVRLEALPLSPNGKLDRHALPAPERSRLELEETYIAPRNPVEEVLAGIWAEVLGLERVGIHDNFFEVGGHSLLATQVIARVHDAFQVELSLRSLFEVPTVAGLAERIEMAHRSGLWLQGPPLQHVSREGDLPLSFAQERLWFLDQWEPGSSIYNISTALRLNGRLHVSELEQSLNELVRRHETLCTTFATIEGRAVQIIAPVLSIPLTIVNLSGGSESQREAEVRRLATQEAQCPFDLAHGPLLRARLLRLADEEHVLLLTMHHIVADGWSLSVFFRELAALYAAYSAGKPSPLPELPLQYADFALWQRQWLQGEVLEAQLAYWRQQLADAPAMLDLPTDRPRPAQQSFRGASHVFALSSGLTEDLRALSRRKGVTLFMTLLAAFVTLLSRYSGQEDLLVGSPIANRTRAELEGLIGFFVNTLVLRTDLSGNPSFQQLLGRVREVTLEAYAHQDLPFEKLVEELQPRRDPSRSPLVQAMFVLQNAPREALELAGVSVRPLPVERTTANFDLTLQFTETAEGLAGMLEYNTDLFEAATISRMAGHYRRLLEGIVADPQQRLSELPLLTEAERQQLLVAWNATTVEYPQQYAEHGLVQQHAERTPHAVAVVAGNNRLTYAELNGRADQLANYLRAKRIGPDVLVGICMERSLDMIVSMLGVLKARGAYVPLDPAYPRERLAFLVEDSQAAVVLTHSRLLSRFPERLSTYVCLDREWEQIAQAPPAQSRPPVSLEHLAYVIYTSGSTGTPKGVEITHRSLLNLVFWHLHTYQLTAADRCAQLIGAGFDASVLEIWNTLTAGACLFIVDEQTRLSPQTLRDWLVAQQITFSHMAVPLAEELLALQWPAQTALRILFTGGDRLHRYPSPELPFTLVNQYGPTECTVVATETSVSSGGDGERAPSIGRPIANVQVYVLDRHLQPVPIGVPGELHIGGVGVARGYHRRPELTREKFIANPWSTNPDDRLYKTGDLVRYLPTGDLEFLGRNDEQVKLRGFRIELGEIEAVLGQHPAVRETVVLAREDVPGDKRLVAYVVAHQGQQPTPASSELRHFLQAKLPDYMIPTSFVLLEAMPQTPNGKVDRYALPVPDRTWSAVSADYVPPSTPIEKALATIWADVLRVERVGIHDNFFGLGGDSILSIQVVARANQAGLGLTPKQLFQHQTIAELAAVTNTAPTVQSEQGLVVGPVSLTPIQHWFFEQSIPERHHWNQAMLLEVRQAVNSALLEQAVRHLLVHHDALRLRFAPTEFGWQQFDADLDATVPFTTVDLSALPEAEHRSAIEATAAHLQTSLNLTEGPLLRVAFLDLGVQRSSRLLLVIHHLAVDGVSWQILLEDLQMAYQQLSRGEMVRLPPKTTSFQQWSQRLKEYAQSAELRQELDHWLAESWTGVSRLPVDYPEGRDANTEASADTVSITLSTQETRALLQEVPHAYHTQINDLLLTALVQAFAMWTGVRRLLVDLEGHGREEIVPHVDLSRTVGWFTTLFPVLLDLMNAEGPAQAVKVIKEQLRSVPHRGIGYGVLRYLSEDIEVATHLRTRPQAEVSFNYLGQFDTVLSEASLFAPARESSGPACSPHGTRSHLLNVNGVVKQGQLHLHWTYSRHLHHRATIESLAENYVGALRSLLAHCQSLGAETYTPSDFPKARVSQKELDTLFARINQTRRSQSS